MTMAAMTERHTFQVDAYIQPVEWSHDWARAPDGRYYSNKAPGTIFAGYPFYWLLDKAINHGKTIEERDTFRRTQEWIYMVWIALWLQIIPYLLLSLWLMKFLKKEGLSDWEIQWTVAAILLGNTASFFITNWGGHAFVALLTFGCGWGLYKRRPAWTGLFFGLSLLSDYGNAMLLIPLLVSFAMIFRRDIRAWVLFLLGGVLPGVLWIFYHQTCFGSPFTIPNQFQNPLFIDMATEKNNIWGILVPFPKWNVILELLFGDRRGLLKTQPWVLVFIAWYFIHGLKKMKVKEIRVLNFFSISSLFFLIYMTACFGGWEGGSSPGPRYLSSIFPLIAFSIALNHQRFSRAWKKALAWALLPSLIYFIVFFPMRVGLFGGYFNLAFNSTRWGQTVEIVGALTAYAVTYFFLKRQLSKAR